MSDSKQSKVLLTGSTGFVGKQVVECLSPTYELHAITTRSTQIEGISKTYQWDSLDTINDSYDAVIHMAGLAHDTQNKRDESEYYDVNVGLTEKILEKLKSWNTSIFVYLSSVKAVVDSTSSEILSEKDISTASNVYGRSKLATEQLILSSKEAQSMVVLRPVLIYGKGQKGNLNTLHKLISKGVWFPFKNWVNRRSVLSINNLTAVIQSNLQTPIPTGVYFVSDDDPISTVRLLQLIGKGFDKKIRFIAMPNGMIKFAIGVLPKKLKSFTDKILGSLEVDNSKLKLALGINEMPYRTTDDLPKAFSDVPQTKS